MLGDLKNNPELLVKYDKDNPPTFPISAYVWGDKCNEDYTNKFYIGIYESEDD